MLIQIVSGEGSMGTVETFKGKSSKRAIVRRLLKEAQGGRWAHVLIDGAVYYASDFRRRNDILG